MSSAAMSRAAATATRTKPDSWTTTGWSSQLEPPRFAPSRSPPPPLAKMCERQCPKSYIQYRPSMHDHHSTASRTLSDGVEDQLVPLEALDPLKIHSFDDLARAMAKTSFNGRALGEAC